MVTLYLYLRSAPVDLYKGPTMQISTNLNALNAVKAIYSANANIAQASERISTGLRINHASDDPTGLAIANRLKTQIGSFSKVLDNLSLGTATTQIVDDSLTQMIDILSYMRVAAVAAESSTLTDSDRTGYQDQIDEYVDQIDSIADNAVWNDSSLMTTASSMTIQSGTASGDTTTISFDKITSYSLSIENSSGTNLLSVSSSSNATLAVGIIDNALDTLNEYQSYIGAKQNVLDVQTNVANAMITNQSVAYGKIMDANMAEETSKLTAAQIQRDAATAMLTQSLSMNKDLVTFLLKSSFN